MKFCDVCHNMLYMRVRDDNLMYHCKRCGVEVGNVNQDIESLCVTDTKYEDDFHRQYLSPHIVYDPTLPHTDAIPCTNKSCPRPDEKPSDVIYVKYDNVAMKFLYYCTYCGRFWTTK